MLDSYTRERLGTGEYFQYVAWYDTAAVSRWSALFGRTSRLLSFGPLSYGTGVLSFLGSGPDEKRLHHYLDKRGYNSLFNNNSPEAHKLLLAKARAHAETVQRLTAIPSAQLDLLTAEHLDICSHRLDA